MASAILLSAASTLFAQKTEVKYLSGTDKDHTVAWEFFCSEGRNSGKWTTINVPGHWDTQGFGGYNYGHDRDPHHERGFYRHDFSVPRKWKDREVYIVFEGSMTDTEVRINGKLAGPVHQGSFYQFKYNITPLLNFDGSNRLEVTVSKESANESVNRAERRADYWIFGGIFRPVYIEAQPKSFIERVAIDARHDGKFYMETYTHGADGEDYSTEAYIQTLDGKNVTKALVCEKGEAGQYLLHAQVDAPQTWTSETPNIYKVALTLKKGRKAIHTYEQTFGFRTIEFRDGDGFYVNGVKVKFKGVCRHTFWPESGRASSKELAIEDVNLIKEMNMNAVRMSHYPPDRYFLDVCDSLGLYVINELAGWQKRYDTRTAHRLIKAMITRDVNHPSIVIWANGNEGGFPQDCRDDYATYDPQKRQVIEPWSIYDGVDTKHYPQYGYVAEALSKRDNVLLPTEFLHGLHDGGHAAGLDDYWNLMWSSKLSAGGFLWNLADEGVVRQDLNDTIDAKGNYAPDGILGPHHEKEGSFYAIKEIWSPIYVETPTLDKQYDGKIAVENRYHFTNLKECRFTYTLVRYVQLAGEASHSAVKGEVPAPDLTPGRKGNIQLPLPTDWQAYDALHLTAVDKYGKEIYTWTWNITSPAQMASRWTEGKRQRLGVTEMDNLLRVKAGDTEVTFNKATGMMESVCHRLKQLSFGNGPRFVGLEAAFKRMTHTVSDEACIIEATYDNNAKLVWTIKDNGWIQLDYQYTLDGEYPYAGITFSYPETKVNGATLMANGPYRVWKNRLKGVTFGIHDKEYNNTITGQTWDYPEFKGYYANFYAVEVDTEELPFTLVSGTKDVYLHLFTPQRPAFYSQNVGNRFPQGDISILNTIPGVGTKFSRPEQGGDQGRMSKYTNETIEGTLYLKFGK